MHRDNRPTRSHPGRAVLAAVLLLLACREGVGSSTEPTREPPEAVNRAPETVGVLAPRTVVVGSTTTVTVSAGFSDADGDPLSYEAVSSDPAVATASASGDTVTVTGAGPGFATVAITARDPEGLTATRDLSVRVGSPVHFEDDFESEASLAHWKPEDAELRVAEGLLHVNGSTPNRAGLAVHTFEAPIASWRLQARLGRGDDDGLPSILVFVDDQDFPAYRLDVGESLPVRPQQHVINYRLWVYEADRDRWLSIPGAFGESDAIGDDDGELTSVSLAVQDGRIMGSAGESTLFDLPMAEVPMPGGASTDAWEFALAIIDLEPGNVTIVDRVTMDGIAIDGTGSGAAPDVSGISKVTIPPAA